MKNIKFKEMDVTFACHNAREEHFVRIVIEHFHEVVNYLKMDDSRIKDSLLRDECGHWMVTDIETYFGAMYFMRIIKEVDGTGRISIWNAAVNASGMPELEFK